MLGNIARKSRASRVELKKEEHALGMPLNQIEIVKIEFRTWSMNLAAMAEE